MKHLRLFSLVGLVVFGVIVFQKALSAQEVKSTKEVLENRSPISIRRYASRLSADTPSYLRNSPKLVKREIVARYRIVRRREIVRF